MLWLYMGNKCGVGTIEPVTAQAVDILAGKSPFIGNKNGVNILVDTGSIAFGKLGCHSPQGIPTCVDQTFTLLFIYQDRGKWWWCRRCSDAGLGRNGCTEQRSPR